MTITMASSKSAQDALSLVEGLQKYFVGKLEYLSLSIGENKKFEKVTWARDEGLHGGGSRYEARDNVLFNTASVNVSQVHYDEMPQKNLKSASALSTIIHPKNPHVPSVHIHISLTELRSGKIYWRIMADLNPSISNAQDKKEFDDSLQNLSGGSYAEGTAQGDKYFNIPALNRRRGISHFYLENYTSGDTMADKDFSRSFGEGIIDTYINIISKAFTTRTEISKEDINQQLDYHTLYLFQVLTLDRGTTAGLLVHNQNDLGIMGSLPSYVNKKLLQSWASLVHKPQDELVNKLSETLCNNGSVNKEAKIKLAKTVREHYMVYKDTLALQASGNIIPNTVNNHNQ
jgi:coproporphyrinogen III oxidase